MYFIQLYTLVVGLEPFFFTAKFEILSRNSITKFYLAKNLKSFIRESLSKIFREFSTSRSFFESSFFRYPLALPHTLHNQRLTLILYEASRGGENCENCKMILSEHSNSIPTIFLNLSLINLHFRISQQDLKIRKIIGTTISY